MITRGVRPRAGVRPCVRRPLLTVNWHALVQCLACGGAGPLGGAYEAVAGMSFLDQLGMMRARPEGEMPPAQDLVGDWNSPSFSASRAWSQYGRRKNGPRPDQASS